ncbi:MAG: nuclear transport factor 2 family protein [Chloroflexota bacterium]
MDYTSLIGGGQTQLHADDMIAGWKQVLRQYEATQHLIRNHVVHVSGDTVACLAYVQATH